MKKLIFLLFALIFTFCSCNIKNNDDILLKIGGLNITRYEFEKNKRISMDEGGADSNVVNYPERVSMWKKEFVGRCYVVADAFEKNYDTIISIKKQIKYTGDYMMTQRYGYLWKKVISPIVDNRKKVTSELCQKRAKIYYFDYILCSNKDSILNLINYQPRTKSDFLNIQRVSRQLKSFSSGYFSIQWPFLSLWDKKDYLFMMKEGEVSELIYANKKFQYLFLDHIEEIPLSEKEKQNASTEMQYGTEDELIKKDDVERDSKCKPVLNRDNIEKIVKYIKAGNPISQYSNDIELIKYYINDSIRKVGFKVFLEYYSYQLLHPEIEDSKSLTNEVWEYYMDDYLIDKAKKNNLYNSTIFQLDQKNYQNNLLYSYYINEEIVKIIKIDSLEVINFYRNNLQQFEQPQEVIINIYSFRNRREAQMNQNKMTELLKYNQILKTTDSTVIKGLINYIPNLTIDMNSSNYPIELKEIITKTPIGKLSISPVIYKNKYVLIYKEKEIGKCQKQIQDVYKNIESSIKKEKIEKGISILTDKLKEKYKITIDKTGI